MKRRIAPKLLLLCATAIPAAVIATSWLEEHHLRVREDMEDQLHFLSAGEFAPPQPRDARRALQGQGVMQREKDREKDRCSSPLITWTTAQVREMGYNAYKTLYDNKIIQMAYVYKHYIDRNEEEEYFVNDAQTAELQRRHRDTIAFWTEADIDNTLATDEILLLSMHGTDLLDNAKLVPTILRIFDFEDMSDVLAFAAKVQRLVSDLPGSFDNPLLTMNAVATRSTYNHGTYNGHDDPTRRTKDSIIIGDGVLRFLYDSGLESSGPDFVHAHEFGHHLQFQIVDDMVKSSRGGGAAAAPLDVPSFANDDRKKELMADAIGGYFLAHDRGGDMAWEEIGVFDRTAFGTGDCNVEEEDHHGTPRQRQCAAIWGASRATAASNGHRGNDRYGDVPVLDAEAFVGDFHEAYRGILDLGREECTLILEEAGGDSTSLDYPSNSAISMDKGMSGRGDYREDDREHGIDLSDWLNENNSHYQENGGDPEGEPGITIEDWLKENNSHYQENGGGPGGEPGISIEDWLNEINEKNQHNGVGSRGRPSHGPPSAHEGADRRPASTNLVGTPAGTRPSISNHAMIDGDCDKPWVYCQSSAATTGRTPGYRIFSGRPLYRVSATMAAALLVLL